MTGGISRDRAALILALGLALGTFPLLGGPTVLCALAAFALRLNFPALQLVNHFSTPLQIALLLPFARLGARIVVCPATSTAPATLRLGIAALQAVTGWFCVAAPFGVVLYFTLAYALRKCRRQ